MRRFEEKWIIIATHKTVESSKLVGSEALEVPRCNVLDL